MTNNIVLSLILMAAASSGCMGAPMTDNSNAEHSVEAKSNRLASEISPYLLQHANNPVDWYPWGEEAFARAAKEDKPIFLSIGYATCHWCHVMAHESFENPEVAALMNEAFINIKVDREERPDVDQVYMTVCQMVTGSGGWPLTIIMTPDKKPFFAATYIPRTSRYGRMGMLELIPEISTAWTEKRDQLEQLTANILGRLQNATQSKAPGTVEASVATNAARQLGARFDSQYGGFGGSPKFPSPHNLLFLLHHDARVGSTKGTSMADTTLKAMRQGGIFDHLGYGFHRYSTDAEWLVPHFEKMLYDQALITMASVGAFDATGDEAHATVAREIITYVRRDMTAPGGGFYSAEDADSEGVEGKFYVWSEAELGELLEEDDLALARLLWNTSKAGNFNDEVSHGVTGNNILHLTRTQAEVASQLKLSVETLQERIETIRQQLFTIREKRIHPLKDDKILTDWNGLMIAAMAQTGRLLDEPEYVEAATGAARFVLDRLRTKDGLLLHRARLESIGVPAFLDDYAFMVWGLLELYDATFDAAWLEAALELQAISDNLFWDPTNGGYFFTASDAEKLLVRQKDTYDGAQPSGNSVALHNLVRLGRLTGRTELIDRSHQLASAFAVDLKASASAHTHMVDGVESLLAESIEVVVAGAKNDPRTQALISRVRSSASPDLALLLAEPDGAGKLLQKVAPFTEGFSPLDGVPAVYVCRNFACQLPTTDPNRLSELIEGRQQKDVPKIKSES